MVMVSGAALDVSTVASAVLRDPESPSRATIAAVGGGRRLAAAMCSIARPAPGNTPTQHWPRRVARTRAPCHTRTAAPPGSPTSRYWKVVPEGRATNEDENGHD